MRGIDEDSDSDSQTQSDTDNDSGIYGITTPYGIITPSERSTGAGGN